MAALRGQVLERSCRWLDGGRGRSLLFRFPSVGPGGRPAGRPRGACPRWCRANEGALSLRLVWVVAGSARAGLHGTDGQGAEWTGGRQGPAA